MPFQLLPRNASYLMLLIYITDSFDTLLLSFLYFALETISPLAPFRLSNSAVSYISGSNRSIIRVLSVFDNTRFSPFRCVADSNCNTHAHARRMQIQDATCSLIIFHSPLYSAQSRSCERHIFQVSHSVSPFNEDNLD